MREKRIDSGKWGGRPWVAYLTGNLNFIAIGIGVILAVLLVIVLKSLGPILKPLLIAVFLCILLSPIERFLVRLHIPRPVAYLIIFVTIAAVGFFLGKLISLNVKAFMTKLPVYEETVRQQIVQLGDYLSRLKMVNELIGTDEITTSGLNLSDYVTADRIKGLVTRSIGSLFGLVGNVLVVILLMIFILLEVDRFPARVAYAYGEARSRKILDVAATINRDVLKYLMVKTTMAAVSGAIFTALLGACGVEFYVLWGVSAFVLHFIPYIGSYGAVVLPVLMVGVQFFPGAALLMLGVLGTIQLLLGNYVEPRIMGRELKLSPLVILLALAFWGWLWGVVGVFLAVPITATIKIVMENFPGTKNIARLMSDVTESTLKGKRTSAGKDAAGETDAALGTAKKDQ
jgi:predicted PurR-regulated permease PerM